MVRNWLAINGNQVDFDHENVLVSPTLFHQNPTKQDQFLEYTFEIDEEKNKIVQHIVSSVTSIFL